jgi:pimeloyl-ACP methyl ester carboxylesterase
MMCFGKWTTFPRFIEGKDGTRLYVRLYGDPTRRPLILLHREWDMGTMFSSWIETLSSRWHVIIPDLRGHGLSSKPEHLDGYQAHHFAEDLHTLMQALHLPPAWLYGAGQLGRQVLNAYLDRYRETCVSGLLLSSISALLDPDVLERVLCSSQSMAQAEDSFTALQSCLYPDGTHCPPAFWQRFAAARLVPRAVSVGLAHLFRVPITDQVLRSWSPRPLIVSEGASLARMLAEIASNDRQNSKWLYEMESSHHASPLY